MGRVLAYLGRARGFVGPLLTKELLVTSRRPRYYLLRFGYAAFLGLLIALVWVAFLESANRQPAAWRATHMPEMGKGIVSWIVCFQFGAAQLVSIVLLGSAISEEIYQRTLVPLLTTPIGYGQIVNGKFLGKLVHVLFLLALSLPLLAMVRVLGGVPWGYLLAGVCVTVTACMLTGSVAIFFSVLCRRGILSMLATLGVCIGLYGIVGLILLMVSAIATAVAGAGGMAVVLYLNPVAAIAYETVHLNDPSQAVPGFYWPIHCVLMLLATWGMLKLCAVLVKRLAVRKAIGMQAGSSALDPVVPTAVQVAAPAILPVLMPVHATEIERIKLSQPEAQVAWRPAAQPKKRRWKARGWKFRLMVGSPIIWRELRKPLLRDKIVQIVVLCAVVFYLLYTYAILGASGQLDEPGAQAVFVTMFLLAGMICTAMDAATSIAPEKQARTWPALLSTPVSDWHILLGKAGGTAFRCLPVWVFLIAHVMIFTLFGVLHPLAVVHVLLLTVWANVFLIGMGVYFSTRHRRLTTALLMNVGAALVLWALFPVMAGLLGEAFGDYEISRALLWLNPVVEAIVVSSGACEGGSYGLEYGWPHGRAEWGETTLLMLAATIVYCAAGLVLAWRAKRMFRRDVFGQ
jgi:ABC-type transport system involved in multi-copper enzyme maturation permease subunit